MSFFNVQQRTSSGLSDIGQFPAEIVGSMGSAVIESGSNANGNYVKFADGTQKCFSKTINASAVNTVNKQANWTFPVQFSDTDVTIVGSPNQIDNYGFFLGGYTITNNLNTALSFICNVGGFTNTIRVSCIAIGSWK